MADNVQMVWQWAAMDGLESNIMMAMRQWLAMYNSQYGQLDNGQLAQWTARLVL